MLRNALGFPVFSTLIVLLTSFALAGIEEPNQTMETSGEKPAADSSAAYFAGLLDACQQVDFLSLNERFAALTKAAEYFQAYIQNASDDLPPMNRAV